MKFTKYNMFDSLFKLFNRVVFLKHCYRNYLRLIENVQGK